MSIHCLLDQPKELLLLISECLKPKIIEKKTFGEVFTPMDFINEKMLKDIQEHWMTHKKENIFENETLTWYDPAAGMGNYPIAIYYKLMDGLKNKIPDEKERKKHIIEKQLYMGELNKKNCFIIKQIFNIHNTYTLNLYEGDTLNIDLHTVFGIQKFDVIIGNPPYNKEFTGKNGHASPLYHTFIEYYIDKTMLLSYVVPSRWFSGGRGLNNFRTMMLTRNDIVYIVHYKNSNEIFDKSVNIEGGVNYFLINSLYHGNCMFNNIHMNLSDCDIIMDPKIFTIDP